MCWKIGFSLWKRIISYLGNRGIHSIWFNMFKPRIWFKARTSWNCIHIFCRFIYINKRRNGANFPKNNRWNIKNMQFRKWVYRIETKKRKCWVFIGLRQRWWISLRSRCWFKSLRWKSFSCKFSWYTLHVLSQFMSIEVEGDSRYTWKPLILFPWKH